MRWHLPILVLGAVMLSWPAAAQIEVTRDGEPFFEGRVEASPMPTRKTSPPPEDEGDDAALAPTEDDPAPVTPPEDTGPTETAATDPDRETFPQTPRDRIPGDAPTIETRPLPVLRKPADPTPGEPVDDADGRIKPVPDPDAEPDERGDSRFVRAPTRETPKVELKDDLGAPIPTPETELQRGAKLRQLDKMTGKITTFDIVVGQTLQIARLAVKLDACRAPDDNDTHGTMAHLKIWDTKVRDSDAVFAGWMFADSPALSALDHPRYDLWVINCTTVSGETSAANE